MGVSRPRCGCPVEWLGKEYRIVAALGRGGLRDSVRFYNTLEEIGDLIEVLGAGIEVMAA
ncbi:MAG: hypothetical protein KA354_17265 [Phycisphaerae bacterium]|nr:hypothetical protein [Phycisphaerae bacterium]